METVIFIGVPGSGKSSFYIDRFFRTHVRINLDMLRTRRREAILFRACLEAGQRLVVDNTNLTVATRAVYIRLSKERHFRTIGYLFDVPTGEALARNARRSGRERVPDVAVLAGSRQLEAPTFDEGFDAIYRVRPAAGGWDVSPIARS